MDAFYASIEQRDRPELQGKPVITGKERGIAASMSYEAKARGVVRGMRLFEIRQFCPDAVILPSDYETYSLLSKRFYAIVRRYTPDVEEYSIDECFADLTGLRRHFRASYETIAERIKRFAKMVGRGNVIAGSDCGFATFASSKEVHPSIVWAKFDALAEGAKLASKELWGKKGKKAGKPAKKAASRRR